MDGINIKSKVGRTLIGKVLNNAVKKKLGYDLNIQVEEITVSINEDGKIHAHLNADADIPPEMLLNFK